jgi:hypothetical protein
MQFGHQSCPCSTSTLTGVRGLLVLLSSSSGVKGFVHVTRGTVSSIIIVARSKQVPLRTGADSYCTVRTIVRNSRTARTISYHTVRSIPGTSSFFPILEASEQYPHPSSSFRRRSPSSIVINVNLDYFLTRYSSYHHIFRHVVTSVPVLCVASR